MDANKAERLREIGYQMNRSCGRCSFAKLPRGQNWGVCEKHTYYHLKHEKEMPLSINASGVCPQFQPHPLDDIHGFAEFEV